MRCFVVHVIVGFLLRLLQAQIVRDGESLVDSIGYGTHEEPAASFGLADPAEVSKYDQKHHEDPSSKRSPARGKFLLLTGEIKGKSKPFFSVNDDYEDDRDDDVDIESFLKHLLPSSVLMKPKLFGMPKAPKHIFVPMPPPLMPMFPPGPMFPLMPPMPIPLAPPPMFSSGFFENMPSPMEPMAPPKKVIEPPRPPPKPQENGNFKENDFSRPFPQWPMKPAVVVEKIMGPPDFRPLSQQSSTFASSKQGGNNAKLQEPWKFTYSTGKQSSGNNDQSTDSKPWGSKVVELYTEPEPPGCSCDPFMMSTQWFKRQKRCVKRCAGHQHHAA